jgi:hypothetical protein
MTKGVIRREPAIASGQTHARPAFYGGVVVKKLSPVLPLLAVLVLAFACSNSGGTTTSTPASAASSTTQSLPTTVAPTSSSTASTTSTTSGTTTSQGSTQTSVSTGATAIPGKTYTAQLSGKDVVPAVDTQATGSATFTVDSTGTRMHFVLTVGNITDVIASRVHVGKPGANGPGVLILYPGPTRSGTFTGALAGGNFGPSALIGQLADKTIADFVDLIISGQAYVNVGTVAHPEGEIRGQLQ